MKDGFVKAYNKLVKKYNKKGCLTDDDFVIITESFDIPLIMLSELQDRLYNEGIVITDSSSGNEKASREQINHEKSYHKKRETHDKSSISIRKDKYEMFFDEMEASDPLKVKELFFDDYNKARIQSTYIPVLILAFIENANEHGTALMEKIVSYYRYFYTERKNQSLIVERSDSIFARSEPGNDEIKRLILFNPLGRSFLKKYFRYDKHTDSICINTKLWMGMSYSDGIRIREKSKTIISEYYKKLSLSGSSGDDKDLAPYWQSNCKFSFSRMHLYYAFGYYKEEEPLFQTEECVIVIDNNLLNEISVSENLYNILEKVDEFTLSPVLAFIQDEKRQCSLGVHGCIQEPLNGKAYGSVNAKMINAPFIEYSPLVFECRITDRKKEVYGSYISTKISAEIVNTIAYKSIVIDGEVDVVKLFGLKGLYTKPF